MEPAAVARLPGQSLGHRALSRLSGRAAAFAAGWISTQVATAAIALVLALQHLLAPEQLPVPPSVAVTAMMAPSLLLAGVAEGLYTVFALSLLRKARLHGLA